MSQEPTEEIPVDLLVVRSGNGGLTAALCAYELGAKQVLVIEKSDIYGGASATSGGMIWIPASRSAQEAGSQDSFEEAREYLQQSIPACVVPPDMLGTYVREAPEMTFLHKRTRARKGICTVCSCVRCSRSLSAEVFLEAKLVNRAESPIQLHVRPIRLVQISRARVRSGGLYEESESIRRISSGQGVRADRQGLGVQSRRDRVRPVLRRSSHQAEPYPHCRTPVLCGTH